MQHPECDDLALLDLQESLGSGVDAHVAGCPRCSAEAEAFGTTICLAALGNYGANAPYPRESVWQAIADELGLDPAATAGTVAAEVPERVRADTVAPGGPAVPFRAENLARPMPVSGVHKDGSDGAALTSVPGTGTEVTVGGRPSRPGRGTGAGSPRAWTRWARRWPRSWSASR